MRKLAISFSGGRSSAVMTKLLWDRRAEWDEVSITFANTGCEDDRTLDFVHECEVRFGWPVVWIEAVVPPEEGEGITHRVVSHETASRSGEPFEAAVSKYGIFNHTAKSCTTKLKELPMNSYRRSIGYRFGDELDHQTAIGIRADEVERATSKDRGFVYPLVTAGITKRDVALEIKTWGFDLQLPGDHFGNCTWCWKKSLRKHLTLMIEAPEVFSFPERMEQEYGTHKAGPEYMAAINGRRYWFRGHQSVADIRTEAERRGFTPYRDNAWDHGRGQRTLFDERLDMGSGCGESCEIGVDE